LIEFINSKINLLNYNQLVFFTGAGMSAESGVPTYRGLGGIWHEYKWEEYACQDAFNNHPVGVLEFHELRRLEALKCIPHSGHEIITQIQIKRPNTVVVTQNIDGMHQRAGTAHVVELHGSLWRLRCEAEVKVFDDLDNGKYHNRKCKCGAWFRPDIVWFQDTLNESTVHKATKTISSCDLFISIGTSAVVWPAAGYPKLAKDSGAYCIEINPEETELSPIYDQCIRSTASHGLTQLF
jgi:NAD-dependent deacetylase